MDPREEPGASRAPTPFDDFLDRLFRGEAVDVGEFLAAHPDLTPEERRQAIKLAATSDGDPARDAGDPVPIERLGPYRLVRRLGVGSTGAVYLAEDESLARHVALKLLGPDIVGTGERAERFSREARAVAKLSHRNIVGIHAAGEAEGLRYIAMEYLPGSGLHEILDAGATQGRLPPVRDVLRWGVDLSNALQCAHEAGLVHRDLKPSNVRIASDGRAVLLDFGIAHTANAATLTESGDFRGSPQFASPEQVAAGGAPIDARTDVYALGVTLYVALTGRPPFQGETREQLFHQILTRDPVPPRRLQPEIPRDLETVVLAMLEKDPAGRPASAKSVASDLEAVTEGRPIAIRPVSRLGRMRRWARRQPAKAALALAVIVGIPLVAALGGYIAANLPRIRRAAADERAVRVAAILESAFLEHGEGDRERARSLFGEALSLDASSAEGQAGLALTYLGEDREKAVGVLRHAGADPGALWVRAIEAAAAPLSDESRPVVNLRSTTSTAVDQFVLGILALDRSHRGDRGAAEEAFAHLQEAVISSPAPPTLYLQELGHAAWHARRDAEARSIAAAIERRRPGPQHAFAVARTLHDADRSKAMTALREAVKSPPRAQSARAIIATLLSNWGENSESRALAIALARETVASDPGSARTLSTLGTVLLHDGKIEEATATLRASLAIEPHRGDVHRVLSKALLMAKDSNGALLSAREAVRLTPDEAQSWGMLGHVLLDLEEHEEAIRTYRRAAELDPSSARFFCNLGLAHLRHGEFTAAVEMVRRGHEIGTKDPKWKQPSAAWLAEAEMRVRLEQRFSAAREHGEPLTSDEKLSIARRVCGPKRWFCEAVSLWKELFAEGPGLMGSLNPDYLLEAAGAAVQGGLGRDVGARPDADARRALLQQARAWARDAIDLGGSERIRAWSGDAAFGAARGLDQSRVGADEAAEWRSLWAEIDAMAAAASRPAAISR